MASAVLQYQSYQDNDDATELDRLVGSEPAEGDGPTEPREPFTHKRGPTFLGGFLELIRGGPINLLLVFLPCALVSKILGMAEGITFSLSLLALAPLAERLGFVTEQLALHTNDSIGGLLNATFGNATELIVAAAALFRGLYRLVQLSMLGSILSNMLLVLGSAFLVGGLRHKTQTFSRISSQMNATLLILSCLAILGPTILTYSTEESRLGELGYSRFTSVLLLLVYLAFLYFQLVSHRSLYEGPVAPNAPPVVALPSRTSPPPSKFSTPVKAVRIEPAFTNLPADLDSITPSRGLHRRENATTPGTPATASEVADTTFAPMQLGEEAEEDAGKEKASEVRTDRKRSGIPGLRFFRRCCACTCICSGCCYTSPATPPEPQRDAKEPTKAVGNAAHEAHVYREEEDLLGFHYAVLWMGILTVLITVLSDMIASSIEEAANDVQVSGVFLAAIVLPIVGNAAEHASAISFAMRNKLDISLAVAVGSSTQIALCVLPLLVILGWCSGHDMSLNFGPFECATLFMCVVAVTFAIKDGTANWLLGIIMVAAYTIVAVGFFAHKNDSLQ